MVCNFIFDCVTVKTENSPDRISPIKPSLYGVCVGYFFAVSWSRISGLIRDQYRFPKKRLVFGRTFNREIWQVRRIQASLLKTGDGQPSFFTLVQMRGQFSLRSVGLPCDTLILVCIMTWLIVRLLEGKHSVRFFSFNLFISASNISAPKPPKCPPNLMWRSRSYSSCLGRNRPSTTSTGGNFVLQKVP